MEEEGARLLLRPARATLLPSFFRQSRAFPHLPPLVCSHPPACCCKPHNVGPINWDVHVVNSVGCLLARGGGAAILTTIAALRLLCYDRSISVCTTYFARWGISGTSYLKIVSARANISFFSVVPYLHGQKQIPTATTNKQQQTDHTPDTCILVSRSTYILLLYL